MYVVNIHTYDGEFPLVLNDLPPDFEGDISILLEQDEFGGYKIAEIHAEPKAGVKPNLNALGRFLFKTGLPESKPAKFLNVFGEGEHYVFKG